MNLRAITPVLLLVATCAAPLGCQTRVADTIFTNSQNTILTMVDDGTGTNVLRVSGLAVSGGKILAVGDAADVLKKHQGKDTQIISLNGTNALLPGFVDPHSHIFTTAEYRIFPGIRPVPFSAIRQLSDVYATLTNWAATNGGGLGSSKWIVGTGFDPSNFFTSSAPKYGQSGFPTRLDLDAAFPDKPVVLIHYSGHIAVANTLALKEARMMGITTNNDILLYSNNFPVPPKDLGTPNGILLESGVINVAAAMMKDNPAVLAKLPDLLAQTQQELAAQGITTTQEGAAPGEEVPALFAASLARRFSIDVVVYLLFQNMEKLKVDIDLLRLAGQFNPSTYANRLRVGGIKLVLDGTPPAETAWLTSPYYKYVGLQNLTNTNDYIGVQDQTNSVVNAAVKYAYDHNIQVMAHVNGDAALWQYLHAIGEAKKQSANASRATFHPVAIHSQITQRDQIRLMHTLGVVPSFFPDHVYYFGEQYASTVLGTKRAESICATGWAKEASLQFTLHNDTPMMPNNLLMAMWAAVNRVTYDYSAGRTPGSTTTTNGYVLGPDQRITVLDALKAITVNAARQYSEDSLKGTLAVGKLADLVVLDQDPTATPAIDLRNRVVLRTFKEGVGIYTNASVTAGNR